MELKARAEAANAIGGGMYTWPVPAAVADALAALICGIILVVDRNETQRGAAGIAIAVAFGVALAAWYLEKYGRGPASRGNYLEGFALLFVFFGTVAQALLFLAVVINSSAPNSPAG
jgi:hypothetical protein